MRSQNHDQCRQQGYHSHSQHQTPSKQLQSRSFNNSQCSYINHQLMQRVSFKKHQLDKLEKRKQEYSPPRPQQKKLEWYDVKTFPNYTNRREKLPINKAIQTGTNDQKQYSYEQQDYNNHRNTSEQYIKDRQPQSTQALNQNYNQQEQITSEQSLHKIRNPNQNLNQKSIRRDEGESVSSLYQQKLQQIELKMQEARELIQSARELDVIPQEKRDLDQNEFNSRSSHIDQDYNYKQHQNQNYSHQRYENIESPQYKDSYSYKQVVPHGFKPKQQVKSYQQAQNQKNVRQRHFDPQYQEKQNEIHNFQEDAFDKIENAANQINTIGSEIQKQAKMLQEGLYQTKNELESKLNYVNEMLAELNPKSNNKRYQKRN